MTEPATEKEIDALLTPDPDELMDVDNNAAGQRPRTASTCSSTASSASGPLGAARAYRTVRAAKLASLKMKQLPGGKTSSAIINQSIIPGSFFNSNDCRELNVNNVSSNKAGLNISASFDMDNMTCSTCMSGPHPTLLKDRDAADSVELSPQCFVITDQNFPAAISACSGGNCLKILRIENGSINDIVTCFLNVTMGFTMPAGSVVLLGSTSHLAWVGTSAYCEDLVEGFRLLHSTYGKGLWKFHSLPVPTAGLSSNLLQSLRDVCDWYETATPSPDLDLSTLRKHFETCYLRPGSPLASGSAKKKSVCATGSPLASVFRLPTSDSSGSP